MSAKPEGDATVAAVPPDRRWRPHADVVTQRLGEAGVVVDLRSGAIFELNATALRIWELLSTGTSREAILDRLSDEFGPSTTSIEADVDDLVTRLLGAGLLES